MLDIQCLDRKRSHSQSCLAANGPVDCSLAFASHNYFPWKTVHSTLPEKGHQAAMSAQTKTATKDSVPFLTGEM